MGVYIKDMEMPKDCGECFACKAELSQEKKVIYVCCFTRKEYGFDGTRMNDCPLVPVPPHGRLKDADALLKKCEFVCTDDDEDIRAVRYSIIEEAATIIPAEDEHTMEEFMYGQEGNPNDGSM